MRYENCQTNPPRHPFPHHLPTALGTCLIWLNPQPYKFIPAQLFRFILQFNNMQSSKKIHYDFFNAIKSVESANSDDSHLKAADDFFARYTIRECQQILTDFITKLYHGNFDRFYSADARSKLFALYERANNLAMTAYMEQVSQMLNRDNPKEEGGRDQH